MGFVDLKSVEPNGKETIRVFGQYADGSPFYEIEVNTYPKSPEGEALRELRLKLKVGLRIAARELGLTPSELSGLENGMLTCDWSKHWDTMADILADIAS